MRLIPIVLAASIAFAMPAMAQETATTEATYDASTVLARVNERDITLGHVIAIMERLPEQYQTLEDDVLFPGILDQLIDQAMISDTVSASPETDNALVRTIMQNERLALISKTAIDNVIAEGADEAEVQKAYDAQYGSVEPTSEFNASHILVETAEEAQAVIASVNDGADFAEVAKEKSTGPSGPNGGELGWFGAGVMVPEFEQAVTGMEVGAVSEPVQTQFGWHVIKLNETRDVPPPSLDDVREELSQPLIEAKIKAHIDGIRANSTIEKFEVDVPDSAIRESELLSAAD